MMLEIMTDSCGNLNEEMLKKYNIRVASLNYSINGKEKKCYVEGEKTDLDYLYSMMEKKEDVRTSLAAPEEFEKLFNNAAMQNKDIICYCISHTLSGTYQSAKIAEEIVKLKYPNIKIAIIDTLNGSFGEGLLAYYGALMRDEGKSFEEIVETSEKNKYNMCGWFTFDDLFHLKRGGRVSSKVAFIGTMLGIKPVMNINNDGVILPVEKLRGRKQAINYMIKSFGETAIEKDTQLVGISHGNCKREALMFANELKKQFGVKNIVIEPMEPVIGTHGGPGALAMFFLGKKK